MGITELLNKGLAHDVVLASWCPTMDLLAIVVSSNNLSVHRLNWQRLWSLPLPCTVTALCWKGDGKMLAVGLEVAHPTLQNFLRAHLRAEGSLVAEQHHVMVSEGEDHDTSMLAGWIVPALAC